MIHHDELNKGRDHPVIALAGGAARHPSYLGDLAGLDAHLIIPHLRGVGRTPMPDEVEAASFWRQAADIERLRVRLDLEAVNLLGHSAGARLAIAYAVQFPENLGSLMLITPPAAHLIGVPSDTDELIARRKGEPAFDEAVAAWSEGPQRFDDEGLTAWYAKAAPMSYATWDETAREHTAEGRYAFAANRAYFSVEPPQDLVERIAKVSAPVLVMAGAEDCSAGVAPVAALAERFPDGRLSVVDGAGHYPWVDQPQAFRAAVEGFLEECASS